MRGRRAEERCCRLLSPPRGAAGTSGRAPPGAKIVWTSKGGVGSVNAKRVVLAGARTARPGRRRAERSAVATCVRSDTPGCWRGAVVRRVRAVRTRRGARSRDARPPAVSAPHTPRRWPPRPAASRPTAGRPAAPPGPAPSAPSTHSRPRRRAPCAGSHRRSSSTRPLRPTARRPPSPRRAHRDTPAQQVAPTGARLRRSNRGAGAGRPRSRAGCAGAWKSCTGLELPCVYLIGRRSSPSSPLPPGPSRLEAP